MPKKSEYDEKVKPYLDKVEEWIKKGVSQKQIAKNLHLAQSTLALYLQRGRKGEEPFSELSDCFAQACKEPDDNVEAALYKSAIGYTVDLQKTFKIKRSEFDSVTGKKIAEYEELVTGIDQQHVPANVEAQKFWLANRRKSKWAYKPEAASEDADNGGGIVYMPDVMTPPGKKPEADKTEAKA